MLRCVSALVLGSALLGGVATPSTAQAGQWLSQGGYSYYRGDDGRWYYYDAAGNCLVWDGVAWQPYAPANPGYAQPYLGGTYDLYGYSSPYYGTYGYGYLPSRNYVYVTPFLGVHRHGAYFHGGIPGHIHAGVGHGIHSSGGAHLGGLGGHIGGHAHGGRGHR